MSLRRTLIALAALAASLCAHAQTGYINTLNGRQFNNMYAANADFLMSQMVQQAGWNVMRLSMEQQIKRKQAEQAGQRAAPAPAKAPAKAAYKHPLSATDFKPAGARKVPEQLAQAVGDAKERQQMVETGRGILAEIEKTPGFRRNNVAAAMTVLLGVSLQVVKGVELTDAETDELMRGVNDVLAGLPTFTSMAADKRTQVYDTMVIVGGLIAGIAQNAAESKDREMQALAQQMARDALAQFGWKG